MPNTTESPQRDANNVAQLTQKRSSRRSDAPQRFSTDKLVPGEKRQGSAPSASSHTQELTNIPPGAAGLNLSGDED